MSTYGVAKAKADLPRLINRAMAGEEVIISRHGKPTMELRPAKTPPSPAAIRAAHERFLSTRLTLNGPAPTPVELMNLIYDDPNS